MTVTILTGDTLAMLPTLEAGSVQTCVTSPPYWGLRDYGHAGQLGLEPTPEQYVARMVEVFRKVKRALRDDGTCWLNLGDSYAGSWGAQSRGNTTGEASARLQGSSMLSARQVTAHPLGESGTGSLKRTPGLKSKDLVGIPWRVAFALQADGWYLRSDIIWAKPNPMPESVTDRPTKAHEYVFLLAKSERYAYHADAIAEPALNAGKTVRTNGNDGMDEGYDGHRTRDAFRRGVTVKDTRNVRTVWTLPSQPFPGAHFATMPPALAERCILAGSNRGDMVLDPFGGAGTTGLVADRLGRNATLIELNPEYAALARARITGDAPLFADGAA